MFFCFSLQKAVRTAAKRRAIGAWVGDKRGMEKV
jgi:hypothetical protein